MQIRCSLCGKNLEDDWKGWKWKMINDEWFCGECRQTFQEDDK
jgi:DNA-directed RNA polymerase subunit N (RpoN/RPB10)